MKKLWVILLAWCCLLYGGCGSQDTDTEIYYDIESETEELKFPGELGDMFLGAQFWQGEPVLLIKRFSDGFLQNIYLCRRDGSRELLVKGAERRGRRGYVDNDKNVYLVEGQDEGGDIIIRYDALGKVVFQSELGADLKAIRQIEDGTIYLLLSDGAMKPMWLARLEQDTGEAVRVGEHFRLQWTTSLLGGGGEGLFSLEGAAGQPEVKRIDLKGEGDVSIFSSQGSSYVAGAELAGMHTVDFCMREDGEVEILWCDGGDRGQWGSESRYAVERLRERRVEKIPLVMCASYYEDKWIRQQTAQFNRENEKYHVVLEENGYDFDWDRITREEKWEEYAEKISIQIAAGKGPDLMYGDVLRGYAPEIAEKGGLEDLAPYMERDGVRQEEYFPMAFSPWRDDGKIRGVRVTAGMTGYTMKDSILGRAPESVEDLVDALSAWDGNEVFLQRYSSGELLTVLLEGTEDIWGMVDWEKGTCDLSGSLFEKLLEVAKRYGDDGHNLRPCLAAKRWLLNLFYFDSDIELEQNGAVALNVMFGDGRHPVASMEGVIAVNSNSSKKEGAWEFIRYLLGQEAQSECYGGNFPHCPVNKSAFGLWVEFQRESVADGRTRGSSMERWEQGEWTRGLRVSGEECLEEERVEEYFSLLEDTRDMPYDTKPIIEIVCEEAGAYFAGSKSVEEVRECAENRVRLYLEERKFESKTSKRFVHDNRIFAKRGF